MASFFEKLKGTKQEVSVEEESVEEKPIIEKPKARVKKAEKAKPNNQERKELFEAEGQLAIDLYQTDSEVVIQAPIAGVKKEDLDIMIENDVIVIKGRREEPEETEEKNYFYQECYWGPFSRQIIMPVEGDPSRAEATMKNGILTIRIPRIEREKKRKLEIKE
jgi:HSP20 family protein